MKAKKILAMIEELREVDGKVVIAFFHKDGWDWPSCQITVRGAWTGDYERKFGGETIGGPLLMAVTAKRAALEPEPKAEPLPFGGPWKALVFPDSEKIEVRAEEGYIVATWVRPETAPLVVAAPELFRTCQTLLRELNECEGGLRNDAVNAAAELLRRISRSVTKPESE